MTKEDVLKWCDKGNHSFRNVDACESFKKGRFYVIQKCDDCPSMRVDRI